jgi:hypothetical protein
MTVLGVFDEIQANVIERSRAESTTTPSQENFFQKIVFSLYG